VQTLTDFFLGNFIAVYFFYGLSFFSMGLLVAIEGGRSADPRLRRLRAGRGRRVLAVAVMMRVVRM